MASLVLLASLAAVVVASGSYLASEGERHLKDEGQRLLLDERTRDVDFLHGNKPYGPRDCNAQYALPLYRNALNAMFTSGAPNPKPLLALNSAKVQASSYDVNGVRAAAEPALMASLLTMEPSFHVYGVKPIHPRTLVFGFDLRVQFNGSTLLLPKQRVNLRLDHLCRLWQAQYYLHVDAAQPAAVQRLFAAPLSTIVCDAGELPRGQVPALAHSGNASECAPVSCLSARACPGQPCRGLPATELRVSAGIQFQCGCAVGFAANNHTLECVPVTCAARPCLPFATCVDLAPSVLDDCNPTPTMGWQWRRGPAPCARYQCVEMTPPTTSTASTTAGSTTAGTTTTSAAAAATTTLNPTSAT